MSQEATTEVPVKSESPRTAGAQPDPAVPPDPVSAKTAQAPAGGQAGAAAPGEFPDIELVPTSDLPRGDPERNIELLRDVSLRVKVELGRGKMLLRDVLRLAQGSVVELEKLAGDPLDIDVNDRLVGKGEVLVLNENFCVRITQIFSPEECLRIKGIQ